MRSRLCALHPENFHNLKKIESSLFTVCLDDSEPKNTSEVNNKKHNNKKIAEHD